MAAATQFGTPKKSKSNNASSGCGGGGDLTPTKRRPVTTPKKRVGSSSGQLSYSPPPVFLTPPKPGRRYDGGGDYFSSQYSSDRFIPNRSALRVDICRASVESAEKNLGLTFEKLSRQQHHRRIQMMGGENGDPNSSQLTSTTISTSVPPAPGMPPGASPMDIATTINTESATTPLQAEFNRRMRGALLNIPVDDSFPSSSRYHTAGSSLNMPTSNSESSNPIVPFESIASASVMGIHNRENIESIVYASMNDDESAAMENGGTVAGGSPTPPRRVMHRMLSFQGTKREEMTSSVTTSSYRSMSSSSLGDSTTDNDSGSGAGISTHVSLTPRRRLLRQASSSSQGLSPLSSPIYHRQNSASGIHGSSNNTVDPFSHDQLHVLHRAASNFNSTHSTAGGAPFDSLSQAENRLRNVTKSIGRRIPKTPSRILDAPELVDDYYLNLVSWSESNVLAVALGQCVYLWEADTGNIKHLLTLKEDTDFVTSVSWVRDKGHSHYIAVGTNHNIVQLWDAEAERRMRSLDGHSARVGALSWNQHWLSSGGRDSLIVQHDVRSRNHIVSTYVGHTQEVCGLKWNDEGSTLASGGNENLLCLWDASMSRRGSAQVDSTNIGPRLVLTHHKAAVKALAWCPFHRGLLASGGGTADRTIKFFNTNSGAVLNSIDTGSQVCSLLWSKHQREICSSHGFSENQLSLWKYPTMTKIQEFKGHTARVLHMDQSPDGGCVVSAAADETLRFWDVFGSPPSERKGNNLTMGNFCGSQMIR
ncbi:hypothetical protein ACHAXH_001157 [Discostella pseudostelligera]|jgi:cell division cycle protein 20 (cofactor of APC complex)